jgi:3'-5' exonuclease
MRDESIVKAGCGIDQDLLELRSVWPRLEAKSRLDLGGLRSNSKDNVPGLKTLAAIVLGFDLPKSLRITTSDWSHVPLTIEQVTYGARDAWVGAAVVEELTRRDPQVFGTAALVKRLQSQPSLQELHQRQRHRQQAKLVLSALRAPYSSGRSKKQKLLPTWKKQMVYQLRNVVKANRHGPVEVFGHVDCVNRLGNSTITG